MDISNGIITEVVEEMGNRFLIVEYGQNERIRLLVDERTVILGANCNEVTGENLSEGTFIDAKVSDRMTRSIPPQATAYLIRIVREAGMGNPGNSNDMPLGQGRPPRPEMPQRPDGPSRPGMSPRLDRPPVMNDVTIGRIWNVNRNNRSFDTITGQGFSTLTRFNVPDNARILNRMGRPINFSELMIGMRVRVTHANFMTASIPPQTTAFEIQVL